MSIKAIFYSKFDIQEGPKVIHQVPEDSIVPLSPSPDSPPLLPFASISRFLIPHQSLCGNLISLVPPTPNPSSAPCLILSYPICITSPHYPRNEFIFNFALVLSPADTIDVAAYKSVVTKLAHLMRSLEEQSHFLSADPSAQGTGKIYSLCEMLMEDLNNYMECMIPIDELNTLNIKLFPTLPNPPPVKSWHVPLFTVRIETLMDENWDLTMQRVIPFIDGVRSVKKISVMADADLKLTKKCIKHLLYYNCLLLLDIFSFSAIYAPTAEFERTIARDPEMQRECARYVNRAFAGSEGMVVMTTTTTTTTRAGEGRASQPQLLQVQPSAGKRDDVWPRTAKGDALDGVSIVQLFASLRQGLTVRQWYGENGNMLANVDMRRFLTFGVIKGFLYRVHRYAVFTGGTTKQKGRKDVSRNISRRGHKGEPLPRSMSSELHFTEEGARGLKQESEESEASEDEVSDDRLGNYFDGSHSFDEICTEFEMSEKDLVDRIKRFPGEVVIINR